MRKHIFLHLYHTTMFGSFLGRTGSTPPNHTDSSHPISTNGNSHNASADMMFAYHGHRMTLYMVYSVPNHFCASGLKQNCVLNK